MALIRPTVARADSAAPVQLESPRDQVSYTIGVQFAKSVQQDGVDLNVDVFAQAMRDVFQNRPLAMSMEDMAQAMSKFSADLHAQQQQRHQEEAQSNAQLGDAFRTNYAAGTDVQTMDNGVLYRVFTKGEGKSPTENDTVRIHYKGKLTDGAEFDSSYARGEPAEFPLTNVIPGFRDALLHMHTGDKWEVVIPPHLAYGERGAPPNIPPNATLLFEIELLSIVGP